MSVIDLLVATVADGPFLLAAPIAAAAGLVSFPVAVLVSFLSPCCLPLIPGYLSYALVTRLGGIMLVAVGIALLTGAWTQMIIALREWVGAFQTVL